MVRLHADDLSHDIQYTTFTYQGHPIALLLVWILLKIFIALRDLHRVDTYHMDIKASNILVKVVKGRLLVKVADTGEHVRKLPDSESATASRIGTEYYMSPEVWCIAPGEAGPVTGAADVWSACMLGLELLEGELFCLLPLDKGLRRCAFTSCQMPQAATPRTRRRPVCKTCLKSVSAVGNLFGSYDSAFNFTIQLYNLAFAFSLSNKLPAIRDSRTHQTLS